MSYMTQPTEPLFTQIVLIIDWLLLSGLIVKFKTVF